MWTSIHLATVTHTTQFSMFYMILQLTSLCKQDFRLHFSGDCLTCIAAIRIQPYFNQSVCNCSHFTPAISSQTQLRTKTHFLYYVLLTAVSAEHAKLQPIRTRYCVSMRPVSTKSDAVVTVMKMNKNDFHDIPNLYPPQALTADGEKITVVCACPILT